jgi:hypothetical protein
MLAAPSAVGAVRPHDRETLMTTSVPATLVLVILGFPAFIVAQTGSERIHDAVKKGLTVSIVDEQGRKIDGRVDGISEHAIRVSMRGRSEEIAADRIVRIDRTDSLRNGALIGLGVGLAAGVLGGGLDPQGRGRRGTFVLVSTIGNGLIYTAFGTAIDALVDKRRTLYQRGGRTVASVSPVVGGGVRGAALSLTW